MNAELGAQRTRFLSDGAQLLAEYSSTNALKARYVQGPGIDEPLLMVRQGKFSYLHQDGLGSVTAVTDQRGALVESYRYTAFGEGTVLAPDGSMRTTSAVQLPYRFTGRELDAETNLYYYRRRYYSQTMGRFLSPDPFPGSPTRPATFHRYAYVENNPINRLDPLGLRAEAAEHISTRLDTLKDLNGGDRGLGPLPGLGPDRAPEPIRQLPVDRAPEAQPVQPGDRGLDRTPDTGSVDRAPTRDPWEGVWFDKPEGGSEQPSTPGGKIRGIVREIIISIGLILGQEPDPRREIEKQGPVGPQDEIEQIFDPRRK